MFKRVPNLRAPYTCHMNYKYIKTCSR
jgi:hypothetical protein